MNGPVGMGLKGLRRGVRWGVGVADVVKAPVHHVNTAVVGVRVPSPAEEKTHIG